MQQSPVSRSIVRDGGGRIIYYPWTWNSLGAMTAYVVDSMDVVQPADRRRTIEYWMSISLCVITVPLIRFNPPLVICLSLALCWVLRSWVIWKLRDRTDRLPRKLAIQLAAPHNENSEVRFIQSAMFAGMTLASVVLFFRAILIEPWFIIGFGLTCGFSGVLLWVNWSIWRQNRLLRESSSGESHLADPG